MRALAGSRYHYDIHGVRAAFDVADGASELGVALASRMAHFPVGPSGATEPDLCFTYELAAPAALPFGEPSPGRVVYDPPVGSVRYLDAEDRLTIHHPGRAAVRCSPAEGVTHTWVTHAEVDEPWLVTHALFTLPFVETLKRRGLYSIHAAALASPRGCVLFAGPSGAGKSTLTLAMLRAGWGFLGDDTAFLRSTAAGLDVLAFPDELDLTPATVARFPELADAAEGRSLTPAGKLSLRVDETPYGSAVVLRSRPVALVLPEVRGAGPSRWSEASEEEVLLSLAPNVLLTDATSAQLHLDALGELARRIPAFKLATGDDLDAIPAALLQRIASVTRSVG